MVVSSSAYHTLRGFVMPFRACLLALLLCVAVGTAAELKTLKGEVVKGDIVSVTAKEIVVDVEGEQRTIATVQLVSVDYNTLPKMPAGPYIDVELVDGTLLHCSTVSFKKKEITVKLLGNGVEAKMPFDIVSSVLRSAEDPAIQAAWAARIAAKQRNFDAVVVNAGNGILNAIECTIQEADDKGENLTFKLKSSGNDATKPLTAFIGLTFQRQLDANAAAVLCKLTDTGHSSLMVSAVAVKDGNLEVKTSAGLTLVYKPDQLVRLDYSSANIAYLSDLTPSRVEEPENAFERYRKDRNQDNGPIRLRGTGTTYPKGLSFHPTTKLEFNLKGEYRTLQGLAGIDELVGGWDRPIILTISADGKELVQETFQRTGKVDVLEINKNVKGVKVLKIEVACQPGDLELGLHLDLADIRLLK
jgi:hypothetical protein